MESYNAWLAKHDIRGCLPPRFKRVFTASGLLGGRWYAVGNEGNYQRMSEAERLRITINGEPVVEADVQASHLSIMHGLIGLSLPDGDPYEFPNVPRSVAKAWITATLGKGSPVKRWAARAVKDNPELLDADTRKVGDVICSRYPFLRRPAEAVAGAARLDKLAHIGTPAKLLTHRLMAIEAQALTGAMGYLRTGFGVLALPMHDGLIVPQSGAGRVGGGLDGSFIFCRRCSHQVDHTAGGDAACMMQEGHRGVPQHPLCRDTANVEGAIVRTAMRLPWSLAAEAGAPWQCSPRAT